MAGPLYWLVVALYFFFYIFDQLINPDTQSQNPTSLSKKKKKM